MIKRIICLWGSPGAGKSETAHGLMKQLKTQRYTCAMNDEYVKDWVWEGREIKPGDQSYIFTKQARGERLYMMKDVDFIVTDSPLALCIFYGRKYDPYEHKHNACLYLLKQHHDFAKEHGYKTDHYFIKPSDDKYYDTKGRYQTKEESLQLSGGMIELLEELNINYEIMEYSEDLDQKIAVRYKKDLVV